MREALIEKKCRLWLESQGGRLYKVRNLSRAGWMDRMLFLPPTFRVIESEGPALYSISRTTSIGFCELKRLGEKPKPHQQLVMDEMREMGVWVFWVDSFERFKEEVECHIATVGSRLR